MPEYGSTTQKVFHLLNFIVNGVRAVVFGFHKHAFLLHPKALTLIVLDLPALFFLSTYMLLVLFWAEIYHQARSLSTDKLRSFYISVNSAIYFIQDVLSAFDLDASLLDHPIQNLIYYSLVEILPSAIVLYVLRKLPPKRKSA